MRTSGRPVVTCHALSTLAPRTPNSSCGLESIAASPVLPELSFQSSLKSFGTSGGSFCGRKAYRPNALGSVPGGGFGYGKSARATSGTSSTTASDTAAAATNLARVLGAGTGARSLFQRVLERQG